MFLSYALVGAGEAFLVNPVLQHVAYSGADPSLRSLMQALCLFAMEGLPNAISAAMTEAMESFPMISIKAECPWYIWSMSFFALLVALSSA